MVHVVIADDDEVIRDLVRRIVSRQGWTCDTASDGLQARELVERLVPDLVITDMSMTLLNGMELLRVIKADPRLAHIPVVIMSSVDRESEARELGCAAFIPKPFTLEIMLHVLTQLVPANRPADQSPP